MDARELNEDEPEPLVGRANETREMPLDILDVVQFGSERILNIHDKDFPVGLAFVKEGHDAEDLDLLDLADIADLLANLADIEGVVVALGLGLGMRLGRVFPSLYRRYQSVNQSSEIPTESGQTWGKAP